MKMVYPVMMAALFVLVSCGATPGSGDSSVSTQSSDASSVMNSLTSSVDVSSSADASSADSSVSSSVTSSAADSSAPAAISVKVYSDDAFTSSWVGVAAPGAWAGAVTYVTNDSAVASSPCIYFHINADGAGFQLAAAPANINDYATGSICFSIKTASVFTSFAKIAIKGTGYDKQSTSTLDTLGFPNDNTWKKISVPLSTFGFSPENLSNASVPFSFVAIGGAIDVEGYIDDIYYTNH